MIPKSLPRCFAGDFKRRSTFSNKPNGGCFSFKISAICQNKTPFFPSIPFDLERECQRLCGYPDNYSLNMISESEAFDLLGNTVCVPVIKEISERIGRSYLKNTEGELKNEANSTRNI